MRKQRYKRTNYFYDFISGNVNQLIYQQDSIDQFIQNYEYDADNRLITVQTSQDSLFWENDASYEYYDHGALAREVIGRRQVQGIDYTYTLNGWLKGVNSGVTNPSFDPSCDGNIHGNNSTVARDAFGFNLNYYNCDYRSVAKTNFQAKGLPITSLYNGLLAGATYSIQPLTPSTIGYTYRTDQMGRLVSTVAFKGIDTSAQHVWRTNDSINDFKEIVSYDENGNILVLVRHGNSAVEPTPMDSLTYHYSKGKNQLAQVNDAVGATNYPNDIDNETSRRNFQFNGVGDLAKDSARGLDTIIWSIYGKVKEIKKHNGDSIIFVYDPLGKRLEKRLYPHSATADTTKYIRDVKGNIMAIYDRKKDTVRLTEWDIYGNKRLGSIDTIMRMQKPKVGTGSIDSATCSYLEGQKQYELTNHLGNVLVTVSDKKIPVDSTFPTDTLAKYYIPLVINAQDYYPAGAVEPGRCYTLTGDSGYLYSFNGLMKDNDIYGMNNALTTDFRENDPDLGGRWWSPDPIVKPWESPYAGYADNPVVNADPSGADPTDDPVNGGNLAEVTVTAKNPGSNPSLKPSIPTSNSGPVDPNISGSVGGGLARTTPATTQDRTYTPIPSTHNSSGGTPAESEFMQGAGAFGRWADKLIPEGHTWAQVVQGEQLTSQFANSALSPMGSMGKVLGSIDVDLLTVLVATFPGAMQAPELPRFMNNMNKSELSEYYLDLIKKGADLSSDYHDATKESNANKINSQMQLAPVQFWIISKDATGRTTSYIPIDTNDPIGKQRLQNAIQNGDPIEPAKK